MANWQRKVFLNPEWRQAKDGEINYQQLAASMVDKLKGIRPFEDQHLNDCLDEIRGGFEFLAEDADTQAVDIDEFMQELYDWGDQRLDDKWPYKKVCWVDTISR